METMAARVRLPGTGDTLRRMATMIVHGHDTRGYENPLNSGIRSAMDELERLRLCLNLNTSIMLAENTDVQCRNRRAQSHRCDRHPRSARLFTSTLKGVMTGNYGTIFRSIETIAGRLGFEGRRDRDSLNIAPPAR